MTEVKNKAVYEAAKAFVAAALRMFASYLKEGADVPSMIFTKHTFHGDSGLAKGYVEKPVFDSLIYTCMKQIQDLPEYNACVRAMQEDPTISKQLDSPIGTWSVRFTMGAWEYLSHLLERQMPQSLMKLEFNSEIFDKTYSDLEYFFYNAAIPCKAFSPLYNFDSDVDKLSFGEGLRIRRIHKKELEELLDELESFSQLSLFELMSIRYAIEFDYETKKEVGELELKKIQRREANPWEKAHKLVAALRLFKQGYLDVSTTKMSQTLDVPLIVGGTSGVRHGRYVAQKFELKEAELNDFRLFWNLFSGIDLAGVDYLEIAVRRFNYAYERGNLEDKLIDFLVAFEALFFKEDETGESRHKLSVRVSRFLEREYDKRKAVAKRIADFYGKRSAVVHGKKIKLKADYVAIVEDYLRRSIRLFIERLHESNHDETITRLDLE